MDPGKNGAGKRSRTSDLLITNQLLYQLSYSGTDGVGDYKRRPGFGLFFGRDFYHFQFSFNQPGSASPALIYPAQPGI